jgi:hypothetical protein
MHVGRIDQTLARMQSQHFADQQFAPRRERKRDLALAFEREGRRSKTWHPDVYRRQGRKPRGNHLA